jgi:hypothetical protein
MEVTAGSNQLVTAIGAPISKEQTAMEVGTINRLGNELHALNIMLLEMPALDQMVTKAYHLVRQFMGERMVAKITNDDENDENWDMFPAEEFLSDIMVLPKVGLDVVSQERVQADLTQMIQVLANMPGYDIQYLIDLYLDNANVGRDIDRIKPKAKAPQAQMPLPTGAQMPQQEMEAEIPVSSVETDDLGI